MPFGTQMRILRTLADFLLADDTKPFPVHAGPKPVFLAGRTAVPMPRCTPEEAGLGSAMLEDFYRTLAGLPDTCVHSLLVARNGCVVSEGHFAPYTGEVWHVTHSLAKTFTGTAVGLAIDEGLFSLDDPVVRYFPDKLGRMGAKRLATVTVRHLLTMSSGIPFNEVSQTVQDDWLAGMFAAAPNFEPGSKFQYNSMNSYMLSALVQRTSGESVLEYLTARVFEPMGFGPLAWEKSAAGIDKGGWGMYITPEDMVKFGQLYLNHGRWAVNGKQKQLVPKAWIEEATRVQIRGENGEQYGYHIWVDSDDGNYLMNGMFGQNIAVMPRLGVVLAMTAGSPYASGEASANRIIRNWWYTMPTPPANLPANPTALRSLRGTLARLQLCQPLPESRRMPRRAPMRTRAERWSLVRKEAMPATDPALAQFCGVTWGFEKNRAGLLPVILQVMNNNFTTGIQALHLEPQPDGNLLMLWEEGDTTTCLPLGPNKRWAEHFATVGPERFLTAASWQLATNEDGEDVLKIQVVLPEHSSTRLLKLVRRGGKLVLSLDESPGLGIAIDATLEQSSGAVGSAKNDKLGAGLLENAFMDHRLHKLCTPQLEGVPIARG